MEAKCLINCASCSKDFESDMSYARHVSKCKCEYENSLDTLYNARNNHIINQCIEKRILQRAEEAILKGDTSGVDLLIRDMGLCFPEHVVVFNDVNDKLELLQRLRIIASHNGMYNHTFSELVVYKYAV